MAPAQRAVGTGIIRYEPRLLGEVAALQTRLWSPDRELNARYFRWKHEENPCATEPRVFLAQQGRRLVAMRGFFGSRWEGGALAEPVPLPIATDAVVTADQEGSGVMATLMARALADLAAEGVPLVLNLNASPVTLISSLAAGWRATGPLETFRHGQGQAPRNRLREWLTGMPILWRAAHGRLFDTAEERRPFAALDRRGPGRLRQVSGQLRLSAEARPAEMADLIARAGHDGRLRQVRDAQWLAWRYANPLAAYRFIYWEDRRLEGFIALQKSVSRNADRLHVSIMDCETADGAIANSLLRAVAAAVPDQPVLAWRRALPRAAADALCGAGFREHPLAGAMARQRPCLLVKAPGAATASGRWTLGGLDAVDLRNWDLRRLYGD
jgi:hypothetical protein